MKKRKCLWCGSNESKVSFEKDAHIIPQSIGGKELSNNECDECNEYFGIHDSGKPAIDTVFKEAFNLTRYILLDSIIKYHKIDNLPRFKSTYFKINKKNRNFNVKPAFRVKRGFQGILCRQFKRGLFKVFLETYHEETGRGFGSEFDFIREFVRYNLGDYPIFYFNRRYGAILTAQEFIKHPVLMKLQETDEIMNQFGFYEFEILGHMFSVPTLELIGENKLGYIKSINERWASLFSSITELKYLTQIDLAMKIMNRK